jgi:molybdopterin converting factor small subunit
MEKNNLEKFIRANRESFDLKEPRPELWYEIDRNISKRRTPRVFRMNIMGIAASAVLLIGLGIGIAYATNLNSIDNQFYTQSKEINNFPEVEKYYLTQINNKTGELKELGMENSVEENLEQLDQIYAELKEEFLNADGQNKEMIVDAMIKNYQTKIEILELILGKSMQGIEQEKTMENETIKI